MMSCYGEGFNSTQEDVSIVICVLMLGYFPLVAGIAVLFLEL